MAEGLYVPPYIKYKYLLWVIIGIGIFIRLYHLIDNRSLWEDEIYLSTGLVNYNFHQLITQPLPIQQKAPIGYLLVVKCFTSVFGNHEAALRSFSFICSILSLLLFVPVTRYFLKPAGSIAAIAILAFAPTVVYHGVEAKQYAVELFATILILYLYTRYHFQTLTLRKQLEWGLWGALIVWFSFSSVFVMAAMAFSISVTFLYQKKITLFIGTLKIYAFWFTSFFINYILFTGKDIDTGWLVFFWEQHNGFMPISAAAFKWMGESIVSFLNYPMGLSWFEVYNLPSGFTQAMQRMIFVPLILAAAGAYHLYFKNPRLLILVASAFLITMVASALKLYPFHERLTLFLTPLFLLLLGAGCDFFGGQLTGAKIMQAVMVVLLIFGPVKNTFVQLFNTHLFGDYKKSYQREALLFLKAHYRPGDIVYVYWNDLPGYRLYTTMYNLPFTGVEGNDYRHQSKNFNQYFEKTDTDLSPFMGRSRVWIVQNNHINIPIGDYIGDPEWYYAEADGPGLFYKHILTLGKEVMSYKTDDGKSQSDIGVTLMDFSK